MLRNLGRNESEEHEHEKSHDDGTGIREIDTDPAPSPSPTGVGRSAWYSLDGRKLDGKPTKSGVYIREGKKVVIK